MRTIYKGDARYEKIKEQMDLLGITDVTTERQVLNGTIIWQLPIKINYRGNKTKFIEVGSFSTGYVRNQNCGYSNYQLNKRCLSKPQYYPEYKWCEDKDCNIKTGKYHMFQTRACVLIPIEIDRLEYLMSYCLKNYFIKHANHVSNGDFLPRWQHEYKLKQATSFKIVQSKNVEKIGDLEEEIIDLKAQLHMEKDKINDLENKLAKIERIARVNASYR